MTDSHSDSYRILHLSDIHFGTTFDRSAWEYIEALVKREQPELIVATGDIVDHGGLFLLALARMQLDKLAAEKEGVAKVRAVPGNHDCGPWGNFRIRPFSTNFSSIFGLDTIPLPECFPTFIEYRSWIWPVRWMIRGLATPALYLAKWFIGLRNFFIRSSVVGAMPVTRRDDPKEVVLVYLDSNHSTRLATGNVDVRELTRLKSIVLNFRDEPGYRSFVPRIALVHHHPLPIPHSKITEGLTSFEPFLILRNAGIVLRELNRCDVDIILHGHKHYSNFARLGYSLDHSVEGEIAVLGAGSAGVTYGESGRNSVNFIDVFRNGRMTFTSIYFGGGGGEPVTELFRNTQYVHGMHMHKQRLFRRGVERHGQWAEKMVHVVKIDARGSAVVEHQTQELRFERDLLSDCLPITIAVSMGRIPNTTLRLSEASLAQGHKLVNPPSVPEKLIHCKINVGQKLTSASPPVTFGYRYLCFNTYAITEWETIEAHERDLREGLLRTDRIPGIEFTGVVVRFPLRQLVFRVSIPQNKGSVEPWVRVMRWSSYPGLSLDPETRQFSDNDEAVWISDTDLTQHERGCLVRVSEDHWELQVDFPLVGHRYDIVWRVSDQLGGEQDLRSKTLSRGVTQGLRKALLGMHDNSSVRQALDSSMKAIYGVVLEHVCRHPNEQDNLSLALFVYDESAHSLRRVSQFPKRLDSGEVDEFLVPLGEGVVGASMKRGVVVSYVAPSILGTTDDAAYLYNAQVHGGDGDPKWKYVFAFPLFGLPNGGCDLQEDLFVEGSWEPDTTVGILTLSSTAPDSGLIRLMPSKSDVSKNQCPPNASSPSEAGSAAAEAFSDAEMVNGVFGLAHLMLNGIRNPSNQEDESDVEVHD